jgi:hypothetical protein
MLVARCWRERWTITRVSIGSHQDYGERMPLSFNEEIQSGYYQNTSVSIEGASIEWVDKAGAMRTCYFGHWPDNSKQDAAATMHNMGCNKLCIDGCGMQLVNGLMVGGTVWMGTNGAAMSYRCGKSIYRQGKLLAELHITIDVQVEVPGHGKLWLDGKTGSDKRYCQQCMCCILTPEAANGRRQMLSAKCIERDGITVAVSPADKCIHLLSNPT